MAIVSPSILAADFGNLQRDVEGIGLSGGRWVHFDVMDGTFVPNISFGIPVLKAVRKITPLVLDVHLMIDRPLRYVEQFCSAGADLVNVHVEADSEENIKAALLKARSLGKKTGVTIKPKTPAGAVAPYLGLVDLVLVMTVEPGFGGQSFMHDQLPKIAAVRKMLDESCPECELEVDGGVDAVTAKLVKEAGANVLVAGSAVFGKADRAAAVSAIREA